MELSKSLTYENQAITLFHRACKTRGRKSVNAFRPYLIFKKSNQAPDRYYSNLLAETKAEKEFDDYQQPVEPSRQLIELFTDDGNLIVDPFLGTGTNAVAASLVGSRNFIGSDIRSEMIDTAKHRVITEGGNKEREAAG